MTSSNVCFYIFLHHFDHPCQTELQQQESLLYKERKERERILISYRKQVEEHKARAERANRRVQYSAMHGRRQHIF